MQTNNGGIEKTDFRSLSPSNGSLTGVVFKFSCFQNNKFYLNGLEELILQSILFYDAPKWSRNLLKIPNYARIISLTKYDNKNSRLRLTRVDLLSTYSVDCSLKMLFL